jgi:hypothetical protein
MDAPRSPNHGQTASLFLPNRRPGWYSSEFFAKFAIETLKAKRIAIMHDNQDYGRGVAEDAKSSYNPLSILVRLSWFITMRSPRVKATIQPLSAK